jgi:hypothetical protein
LGFDSICNCVCCGVFSLVFGAGLVNDSLNNHDLRYPDTSASAPCQVAIRSAPHICNASSWYCIARGQRPPIPPLRHPSQANPDEQKQAAKSPTSTNNESTPVIRYANTPPNKNLYLERTECTRLNITSNQSYRNNFNRRCLTASHLRPTFSLRNLTHPQHLLPSTQLQVITNLPEWPRPPLQRYYPRLRCEETLLALQSQNKNAELSLSPSTSPWSQSPRSWSRHRLLSAESRRSTVRSQNP